MKKWIVKIIKEEQIEVYAETADEANEAAKNIYGTAKLISTAYNPKEVEVKV